jgi:PAS domain S-box-containing protein
VAEFYFYSALARAGAFDCATEGTRQEHFEALANHHRQLAIWADNCPENFENRAALVGAEIARIEGRDLESMRLYEQAIRSAHVNGFVHNEAVANELGGRFYLARGIEAAAYAYLSNARNCYDRWGAHGKVKQLEDRYPRLREEQPSASSATIDPSAGQFDVETVVKASQALSSEIVLPKLVERLMRIALEHAGAERGLLALIRDGEPWIEAEATTGLGEIEVAARRAAITPSDLPQSVLHYAIRTQVRVLLDDASSDDVYSRDEYVRLKRSRSVLCLPIVKQAKLVGALYLENNLTPGAFTPDRVTVLALLASQAAISLENVALYTDLQLQVGLLHHLPVSAWTLKPDGTPDFVNQVWLEFAGQTVDFVRSRPEAWMTAVHPEDREIAAKSFREGVHSGEGFAIETRSLRARDGTYRWHLNQAVVLRDSEGKVLKFVGTTTDIDDQKRTEEALREMQMVLAHNNRVATVGQLTASISHEVKQPLSAAMTNAQAALRFLNADPPDLVEVRDALKDIVDNNRQAGEIVDGLRALIKREPPRKSRLNINEAIREVIGLARREATSNGVSIKTHFDDDIPLIEGDRVQLQQVVLNLIMNAVEAMGGMTEEAREIFISTGNAGTGVHVEVRDSGPGLAPTSVEHLFDAFYTTKPNGLGLGLSICRSIVEAHGSLLRASNNVPRGAVFQFTLNDRPGLAG